MSQTECTTCRVYEASIPHQPTWSFSLCLTAEQEAQLMEDIWLGRKLITLGRLIAETDCARARAMADHSLD